MALHKLTARQIEAATGNCRLSDGGCLYLSVRGRSKVWVFRYERKGKTTELGIGPLHTVNVAEARRRAGDLRLKLLDGEPLREPTKNPVPTGRQGTGAVTFGSFVDGWVPGRIAGLKGEKTAEQYTRTFEVTLAALRPMRIDRITTADVVAVLREGWLDRQATYKKVRQRLEDAFDAARALGHRQAENPATMGLLEHLLPRQTRATENRKAMALEAIPEFWRELRARRPEEMARNPLSLLILTGVRTKNVLGARWDQIDLDRRLWTIPRGLMKVEANADHVVPLSAATLAVLREARDIAAGSELVFPGRAGAEQSDDALRKIMRKMGRDEDPHGFRSCLTDFAGDHTDHDEETAEFALHHRVGGTRGAYRRRTALEKRRDLMEQWAAFVCGATASENVPPLRA